MNYRLFIIAIPFLTAVSNPVCSSTNENIAKAYVQAITGGSGPKSAGTVDFESLDCIPANVFVEGKCQTVVFDGKDGKTILMEAITATNIGQLVPIDDLRRIYQNLYDSSYRDVRRMFAYLSTNGNGWYAGLDGEAKAKAILQAQLESTGPGGMYGNFDWPFDASGPEKAKITSTGVDFIIKTLPPASELDIAQSPLYYWALQTDFSDMAYPPGFPYPQPSGKGPEDCKNTTTAWGHVGLQYMKNDFNTPKKTYRRANWGGGGDGSGVDDYGCGGSDVSDLAWKANTWYEYRVTRGAKRGPKLWDWIGSIYKKGETTPIYTYTIFGGEYVTYATTWAELINVGCTNPKLVTQWANPWMGNNSGKFRVSRISLTYGGDACMRSKQVVNDRCNARWTQHQGATEPVGHAGANLLRKSNSIELLESYCERKPDATEKAIARAYVQAISEGGDAKHVSGAVDFFALGCAADTVWDEDKCQKPVFNRKDGKTVLMEAITPATDGNWETSNIKSLIPEETLRRILTDARYAQAREIFGYMSDPSSGWYPYLAGPGKAKDVLLQYMNSIN